MNKRYHDSSILTTIKELLSPYFSICTRPTARNLIWVVIAMVVLGGCRSVRWLFEHFLNRVQRNKLNAFYYACDYAKNVEYLQPDRVTAAMLLDVIPKALRELPIYLVVDDTLVEKFGEHFENVRTLFDHAAHDGQAYKNGHCFVTLVMSVPVGIDERGEVGYRSVPLRHSMWIPDGRSKLEMARDMVLSLRDTLSGRKVVVLGDCWYIKNPFLEILEKWPGLEVLGAVRIDTAMFLPPPPPTGKRGRPRKYGDRVEVENVSVVDVGIKDYYAGVVTVITRLLGPERVMTALVTATDQGKGTRRLYLTTMSPTDLQALFPQSVHLGSKSPTPTERILFDIYHQRWNIEVSYLELKTWWDFARYMLRSQTGIEVLLNLLTIAYAVMKLLPYKVPKLFGDLVGASVQEIRFKVGQSIRRELFFAELAQWLHLQKIDSAVMEVFHKARRILQ